ncbi:MAG: HAMP domain-containing histidine kinase [Lachnospiraceae bacterium]|nr:HAMP domain-containing histidine kinase [Lachnospiraceae bacterium]
MPIEPQSGLPGELLLLFTVIIWMLFIIIRLGNPQNVLNRWCFISGMIFSIGVLKEYLYFTLFPWLSQAFPSLLDESGAMVVYSVLTGFFYYFSMPCALIFSLYFSRINIIFPKIFSWLKVAAFIPGLLMGFLFPYSKTRYFQLHFRPFFPIVTIYNAVYGLILTYLILHTLYKERKEPYYPQKKRVAILVLLPIWYWIISALLVHSLILTHLFKAWQGNFLILLVLLVYFLSAAFRGGIMGTRFRHEIFDWDKDGQMMGQGARCIRHLCKNELSKINWCAKNLASSVSPEENASYADIIFRSTEHLKNCMEKMQYYSQEIRLEKMSCPILPLLHACTDEFSHLYPGISIEIECNPEIILLCDKEAVQEVFNNLISNAAEAMNHSGTLSIKVIPGRRLLELSFSDTGKGIPPEFLPRLFEPYSTTKPTSNGHMGLGLFFCQKVMKKHGGRIAVNSRMEAGTVFSLFFPWKSEQKTKKAIFQKN